MTVSITHVFRRPPKNENIYENFAQSPDYYKDFRHLARLIAGMDIDERYSPIHGNLIGIEGDGTCTVASGTTDEHHKIVATHIFICIGSTPDLSWLPKDLREHLPKDAYEEKSPIRTDGITSDHKVFVPVDQSTFEVLDGTGQPLHKGSLFAIGSVQGDNFVRFTVGNAFGLMRYIRSLEENVK